MEVLQVSSEAGIKAIQGDSYHICFCSVQPVRIAMPLLLVRTLPLAASHYHRKEEATLPCDPIIPYVSLCKHISGDVYYSQEWYTFNSLCLWNENIHIPWVGVLKCGLC
jgi:hypothetical protein